MKKLITNIIKTILGIVLAPFFIIFLILNDLFKTGAEMFDKIIEFFKNE